MKLAARPRSSPIPVARGAARQPFASVGAIAIDGEVGYEVLAASVREQIASAGGKDLKITINSIGGSVTEGMAIYHAIRGAKGRKVATVEGIAASMASVILQAADVRRVAKGSYVMIHNPSSMVAGESSDMDKAADMLRKIESDMTDIYEARTGLARSEITKMMDAETYMTAEEAVELGFADEVADDATARIELAAVAKLKNPPESLKRLSTQGKSKMTEEEMKAKIKALEEENAKLKAEKEECDEPEHNAEDDDEADAKAEDDEAEGADEDDDKEEEKAAKAVLAAARRITGRKSLAEVEGALMALGASAKIAANGDRAEKVKALIASGRLAPADKKWAMGASDKAFNAYVKVTEKTPIVPVGQKHTPPPAGKADEVSSTELKIASLLGHKDPKAAAIAARSASATGGGKESN